VINYALMFGHDFNEIIYKKTYPSHIEENEIRNILFGDSDEHIKSSCIKDS
jgi:isopentenyldiphosphate isomerase